MKLSPKGILLTAATAGMLTIPAFSAEFIGVQVNGKILFLDNNPEMIDGRVLVPLRGIFQALGAKVDWDPATRSVKAYRSAPATNAAPATPEQREPDLVLPLDSTTATVDGNTVTLEVPARVLNGATMVPLRFVGEAMGAKVKWDGADRIVRVATPEYFSTLEPSEPAGLVQSNWDATVGLVRIKSGSQAGLTKVMDESGEHTAYMRTIDDYNSAQITDEQRAKVLAALGISREEARSLATKLINSYTKEFKYRLQLLSLVGLLASEDESIIDEQTSHRIQTFALNKMFHGDAKLNANDQNTVKRYALLTLALMRRASEEEVDNVVRFYETNNNLWVTSPMPLFFRLHGKQIREMPRAAEFRSRIAAVNSMYTPTILNEL